jgi:tetratricopeptide (TPR) repeat protein
LINKDGVVCYVGKSTPWYDLSEEIEKLNSNSKEPDLSSVELAIKGLKDVNTYIRWKSAKILVDMQDESSVPALINALSDKSAGVRMYSVQALGEIGNKNALELLMKAVDDNSRLVQTEAIKSLINIKDESAIPTLVRILPDPDLCETTAKSLAELNKPEQVLKALSENKNSKYNPWDVAQGYIALANSYVERNMNDSAIAILLSANETISEPYPKSNIFRTLSYCYSSAGEYEKALDAYLNVIRNSSDNGISSSLYGDGTFQSNSSKEFALLEFIERYRSNDNNIISMLEQKLVQSPNDLIIVEALGSIYDSQSMFQKAVPVYEKAMQLSSDINDYARLAFAYNKAGMKDKAVETFKNMEKQATGNIMFTGILAQTYQKCGMYDEAIDTYKKAIAMASSEWDKSGYSFGLTKCLTETGKYQEAINELDKIIAESANWKDMAENIIWTIYNKGNMYDEAIKRYQKMVQDDPKSAKAHESLAKAYQLKGDTSSTIMEYEKLVQIQSDNSMYYKTLGDMYIQPETKSLVSESVLSLDGDNDYVETADSDTLNNTASQITLEAWIKPIKFQNDWMTIIYKGDKKASELNTLDINNLRRSYSLWLNNAGYVHLAFTPNNNKQNYIESQMNSIPLNTWSHIAGVIDSKNGVIKLYLNGAEVAESIFSGTIYKSPLPLRIGWTHENNQDYSNFAGQIDEVRIWHSARTQKEIADNMNTKLTGKEPSLVGYWKFDQDASDSSSVKSDGKLIGNAKVAAYERPVFAQPSRERIEKAVEEYSNAYKLSGDYSLCLLLGQTYCRLDRFSDAEQLYSQAIDKAVDEGQKNRLQQALSEVQKNSKK